MERLNYHHLLYFFTVAREGSVAEASARLGLKQPTVSAQIHALEERLGRKLLERSGRGLKVTPAGETVLRYATSIFTLGGELLSALDGHAHSEAAPTLAIGVTSSLPAVLVAALLHGIFELKPQPLLTVTEGAAETLVAKLVSRSLHFVLSDVHMGKVKFDGIEANALHCRTLIDSAVEVFAAPALARKLRRNFSSTLADAPILLPSDGSLHQEVVRWLARHKLHARKLSLMPHPEQYSFTAGAAVFAPSLLRAQLKSSYGLLPAGNLDGTRWRLFVASAERNFRHPALDAVAGAARGLQ